MKDLFMVLRRRILIVYHDIEWRIEQNLFDYDDENKYDALSAADILMLQSILCKQ